MKPIAQEIEELRGLAVPELVERYQDVFGRPPRVKHRDWLWRRIAWKLQERAYGGLSVTAKKKLAELMAAISIPLVPSSRRATPAEVCRVWKNREIRAIAVEGGQWEHEGVRYRSLSALAKTITGTHVSGPAFFGTAAQGRGR